MKGIAFIPRTLDGGRSMWSEIGLEANFFLFFVAGELYVEDLGERRIVSIRMGWLWVEGTPMRLPLRALNLRQAAPSLCQPHALALGFTLSNSQDQMLATFWVICNLFSAVED